MAERASSRVSVRPPAMATRASRASNEVLQHAHAVGGHDGFGVELHGFERKRSMPERHHNAVVAPGGDDQVRRKRSLVDHQRVVARRFGRIGDPCEDAFAIVPHEGGLAVPRLRGTDDRSAERDRGALEPQADTERRDAELRPLAHESGRTAGDLGTPRAGRDDEAIATALDARPDRLVISPGPGRPEVAGRSPALVRKGPELGIPTLGVCLGLQCAAVAFGASVVRAPEPRHGKTSLVRHDGKGVFAGVPDPTEATRYHSLMVDERTLPPDLIVTARSDDGVVMALRHRSLPLEAVQFHPESVMTADGMRMLENFLGRA